MTDLDYSGDHHSNLAGVRAQTGTAAHLYRAHGYVHHHVFLGTRFGGALFLSHAGALTPALTLEAAVVCGLMTLGVFVAVAAVAVVGRDAIWPPSLPVEGCTYVQPWTLFLCVGVCELAVLAVGFAPCQGDGQPLWWLCKCASSVTEASGEVQLHCIAADASSVSEVQSDSLM